MEGKSESALLFVRRVSAAPGYSAVSGAFVVDFSSCRRDSHTILHARHSRLPQHTMHYWDDVQEFPGAFVSLTSGCHCAFKDTANAKITNV